jgi:hypothetical protein
MAWRVKSTTCSSASPHTQHAPIVCTARPEAQAGRGVGGEGRIRGKGGHPHVQLLYALGQLVPSYRLRKAALVHVCVRGATAGGADVFLALKVVGNLATQSRNARRGPMGRTGRRKAADGRRLRTKEENDAAMAPSRAREKAMKEAGLLLPATPTWTPKGTTSTSMVYQLLFQQ